MLRGDGRRVVSGGPVVGLAQQIDNRLHAGREFLRVAGDPGAFLDHPRHGVLIERPVFFLSGHGGDVARIELAVLGIAVHLFVEIRRHFEQLGKIPVILVEHVVEHPVADEDDFHIQRDRLRLERHRADETQRFPERLDTQLLGVERAFQAVPGERLLEQLQRVEHKIAAVGPVQCAGFDQRELGEQRAHPRLMLGAAHQVLIAGVVLRDDRGSLGLAVVDQQIDLGSAGSSAGLTSACPGCSAASLPAAEIPPSVR